MLKASGKSVRMLTTDRRESISKRVLARSEPRELMDQGGDGLDDLGPPACLRSSPDPGDRMRLMPCRCAHLKPKVARCIIHLDDSDDSCCGSGDEVRGRGEHVLQTGQRTACVHMQKQLASFRQERTRALFHAEPDDFPHGRRQR